MSDLSKAARLLGRKGGLVTSARKRAAVRENGKKGGRPKTKAAQPPTQTSQHVSEQTA